MFSGIIQGKGVVQKSYLEGNILKLSVLLPNVKELQIGASVSINGTCLTVTSILENVAYFDVIEETRARTNLADLVTLDLVNIERACRFGDEIGGHVLSGHILGTGKIVKIESSNITIQVPSEMSKYLFTKGYIAVDGISLTLGEVNNNEFTVHLIPETIRMTTLYSKQNGDKVNIEIDHQTKMIVEILEKRSRFP